LVRSRRVSPAAGGAPFFRDRPILGEWIPFFFSLAHGIASRAGIAFPGSPPTAFRVRFYPILLAGVTLGHQDFWPVVIAQSAIGGFAVLGATQLARVMFLGAIGVRAAN
jgi:hypothetical protein